LLPSPLGLKDRLFYGWVVVAAFLVIGIALYGIHFSFGVFFKSIESEFNLTRAATSAILSANMILAGVCSFFAGWALDRYGPRIVILLMGLFTGLSLLLTSQTSSLWQLFLTYSLLLAMGTGPLYVVPMSAVSRWFDRKRGLALGVASSGIGLGTLIMAPFATYLITNFDWRMAYFIIGLIAWLIVVPLSRLLRRDPYEIGALPDGVKAQSRDLKRDEGSTQSASLSLTQAFRTRSFWFVMVTWFLYASNIFLVMTHLVPHATDIGFSALEAAAVLSLIGGAATAGRVLMGIVADRIGRKVTAITCALLQAGAMVWLIWSEDLWMLYLFALVYGFAFGGMSPVMAALIGDTFGLGKLGAILGLLEVSFGIGAAIGPAIGGFIFDVSHSYFVAFSLGAAVMLVVTSLIALIRRETNKKIGGLTKLVTW
jgi:OFA family oxalate/formate antiporter-like MFS transporter